MLHRRILPQSTFTTPSLPLGEIVVCSCTGRKVMRIVPLCMQYLVVPFRFLKMKMPVRAPSGTDLPHDLKSDQLDYFYLLPLTQTVLALQCSSCESGSCTFCRRRFVVIKVRAIALVSVIIAVDVQLKVIYDMMSLMGRGELLTPLPQNEIETNCRNKSNRKAGMEHYSTCIAYRQRLFEFELTHIPLTLSFSLDGSLLRGTRQP